MWVTALSISSAKAISGESKIWVKDKGPRAYDLSWGYVWTYCCPTRGIVLGLSEVGMVGMKGVVGGSEGRRGE